jgi:hypothetical protein
MISLASLVLFGALAIACCWVIWKLRSTLAGRLLFAGVMLAGVFVVSFIYWVHFYLGDGQWPFYLYWSSLGASVVAFVGSFMVAVFASKTGSHN